MRQLHLLGSDSQRVFEWESRPDDWLDWLHSQLPRPKPKPDAVSVLDLFAGCGGLALGFEVGGFRTVGYEMNHAAARTYATNLDGECHEVFLSVGMPETEADVIIGGPPCQPFSQRGYQRGRHDERDGLPVFIDAMRRIRPKVAIMENVRGLLYRNKGYLRAAAHQMAALGYTVDARILNAVEFGVPQKRERVVVVASRVGWRWPEPSVADPVTVGVALGTLALSEEPTDKHLTASMDAYIARYEARSSCVRPRDLHLDRPARTVTCRNLGGATSDMLRLALPSGNRRRLTVKEGARLQAFPDWYSFSGSEYEQYEQIGNAVPPLVGLALARQVMAALAEPQLQQNGRSNMKDDGLLASDRGSEKVEEALCIMRSAGVPVRDMGTDRRRERAAKALLAVAQLTPDMAWSDATSHADGTGTPITTREIIKFWNTHYGEKIADSSYDDVRRKDLAYLVEAMLVASSAANPGADTNDGTRGYALTQEALGLLRSFGRDDWEEQLKRFRSIVPDLKDRLTKARQFNMVPVTLPDGTRFDLSGGPHNEIQKAVIEDFLPRFSKGARVLYLGDANRKILHLDEDELQDLKITVPDRSILPDIIAYEHERNWLFLIEAVHSSNPIDPLRLLKLKELTTEADVGCLFVTAFAATATFARFAKEISWETEVWIADQPDHLVHFDGGRHLAPYEEDSHEPETRA